ncbi:MAG: hypothetical protein D8H97_45480 [Neisseria sp.]|nr:MAG: hypothetical protein D8H97_45480 [Neisseria sp.]
MGILDSMAQQAQSQSNNQMQQGDMAQMYNMVMDNSLNAIANVAQERILEKGVVDGVADLVAASMITNLQAAQQNGKTIPPQVMMQVAKDLAVNLLKQAGVTEEQMDDVLIDVLMNALDQFGEQVNGMLPPEEEQQYVNMINKVAEMENQRHAQINSAKQPMQRQKG